MKAQRPNEKLRSRPLSAEMSEYYRLRRRIGIALGASLGVIAVGTVGFAVIGSGEHGLIDAIYMTIITLTTVGFSEIIDMSSNPVGRVFTVFVLLLGMGVVAYSIPAVTAFIIEGQLFRTFARRRMEKRIARLENHYVVCGDSAATCYVAAELVRTGRKIVLVTPDENTPTCDQDDVADVPRVVGDPTDDDTLVGANLEAAVGVVTCMESDKDNLLAVLTARRLAPDIRIVAAAERSDGDAKLRAAGADAIVCASRIGGLRMASEMVRPTVVSFLDRMLRDSRTSLRVEEISMPENISHKARTIGDLEIDRVPGALLLAVQERGSTQFDFKPKPETPLDGGMTLIVMADADGRAALDKRVGRETRAVHPM